MNTLEFIIAFSIMPLGALVVRILLYYFTGPDTRLHPGD